MADSRAVRFILLVFLLIQGFVVAPVVFAAAPANDAFDRTWSRTDAPVLGGDAVRTWMWGPEPFTGGLQEPYLESPAMEREVQYFDKSRMELTDPDAGDDGLWYVTNGLLATELITGRMQIGDGAFLQLDPAQVNVAGDPAGMTGPTYATFSSLLDADANKPGTAYIWRVDRNANVVEDRLLAARNVAAGEYDDVTGHTIAEPFWRFMNSSGLVLESGDLVTANLFENPYFAVGRPITEAYWAEVEVAGTPQDVLVQCFERRCLTYTPESDPGWQVEAGNVGQHYHAWRYSSGQQYVIEPVLASDGGMVSLGNAELEIPAGALDRDTLAALSIHHQTIGLPDEYVPVGPLFDVTVAGAGLDGQVTLSLPFDPDAIPDDIDVDAVVAGRWDGTAWQLVAGDVAGNVLTVSTDSLSFWQVFSPASGDVDPPPPPPPSPPPPPPGPGPTQTPPPAEPTATPGPENERPVAEAQRVDAVGGVPVGITLRGTDAELSMLTFRIVDGPEYGTLSTTTPAATCSPDGFDTACTAVVTYTATFGHDGADAFSFTVSDGDLTSQPATVSMTVTSPSLTETTIIADPDTLTANGQDTSTITVTLLDGDGDPLGASGGTVELEATAGTLGEVTDHGDGTYTATYTAATAAGTVTISGTLDDRPLTDTATIALVSGEPAQVVMVTQPSEQARNAEPLERQPVVEVQDAFGNTVGAVEVTASIATGGGTLANVTATTDNAGQATFSGLTITGTVGTRTLAFGVPDATPAVSGGVELVAGAPVSLAIHAGDGQAAVVNTSVATVPAVRVADVNDNPVAGVEVTFAVASGGGSVTGSPATTGTDGIATIGSWTLGTTVGENTLTASTSFDSVTYTATGVAGPANTLQLITGDGGSETVGGTRNIEVRVVDEHGNPVQGHSITWAVTSGGGTVSQPTTSTGADGTTSVTWTLGTTAGEQTVTASAIDNDSNPLIGSPLAFTVQAVPDVADLTRSTISASTTDLWMRSGETSTITVQLVDRYGNNLTASGGTVVISTNPNSISGTTDNNDGTYTATITANSVWANFYDTATITATLDGDVIAATATVNFFVGPLHQFHVVLFPDNVYGVGDPIRLRISALDAYSNSMDFTGYLDVTSTGSLSSGGGPEAARMENGTALPVVTFDEAGTFTVTFTRSGGTESGTSQTITINAPPVAANHTYAPAGTIFGNVTFDTATSSSFSVLTGVAGSGLTLSLVSDSNVGGTFNLNTVTGTFEYLPLAGFSGAAGFTYKIENTLGSDTGTVSFTVSTTRIWFVNAAASVNGTGTLASPFNCLTGTGCASTAAGSGDTIFLYSGSYTGGITLPAGARLIGQGSTASVASILGVTLNPDSTLPQVGGSAPTVTTTAANANGVNLGAGNGLHGLNIGNTSGSGIHGNGFGTLTVANVSISGGGQALDLTTGTLSGSFSSITSTSGAYNIRLDQVQTSGTFSLGTGALSGATSGAFHITGQNGSFTYSGTITHDSSLAVSITNKTGGAVTLSGDITTSGAAQGVYVLENVDTTIRFSGSRKSFTTSIGFNPAVFIGWNPGSSTGFTGGGLEISTVSATGFEARGAGIELLSGTVFVTGSGNTITSGTGTALWCDNMSIGGEGMTFQSISSNGGIQGIVMVLASGQGILRVTGTGTPGSGGTIQNIDGDAIWLTAPAAADLSYMNIIGSSGFGLRGLGISTMLYPVEVTLTNNTFIDNGQGIGITVASGINNVTLTGNTITGSEGDAVLISNSPGPLSLGAVFGTISGNTIGSQGVALSGSGSLNGIVVNLYDMYGTLLIQNNEIRETAQRGISVVSNGSNVDAEPLGLHVTVTGNVVSTPVGVASEGIYVAAGGVRQVCLNMRGNNSMGNSAAGITIRQSGTAVFQLQDFFGVGTNPAAVEGYLATRNPATAVVDVQEEASVVNYTTGTCRAEISG